MTRPPAVFLDRDGTIIRDRHYLSDPRHVELLDGAAASLARLRAAGYRLVIVTNQSGIARGLVTEREYEAVQARLGALLAAAGVTIDGTYMCPHHPDVGGACSCRKPAPTLFARAARELGLDLARSTLIGDRWRDIAAATTLGAAGILVPGPDTPPDEIATARRDATVAATLGAAVDLVLAR